jgi:hypothetical protein
MPEIKKPNRNLDADNNNNNIIKIKYIFKVPNELL